jgi:glucose/arabinose dehydrogenase
MKRPFRSLAVAVLAAAVLPTAAHAAPSVVDPNLAVRTAASGLDQPISIAFIGRNDMLVLEKASGRVQRVRNGVVTTVLDLPVNSASERGLLGIALDPHFFVSGRVYLYWSESSTGADSTGLEQVPLLGNRVDRFFWNGSTLTPDLNIIRIRALQDDATNGVLRGNHDGGVLRFGPDKKLYVVIGDLGRRGQLQNLVNGPFGPGIPDDQFGGPQPDNAHLSGVILRLNRDGTAPRSNPFFRAGRAMGGEVGANVQKIFAYGLRNSFGMDFDPVSGDLWEQENGDDSFSEINRAESGFNSGWVQIMGPPERINQFKAIETDPTAPQPFAPAGYFGLQQVRWSPVNIASSPGEALSRLFMLPGAEYSAPEMSWKFEVAPGGIGFLASRALGREYRNDLFVAGARPFLEGGHLFRLELSGNRRRIDTDDPRLADRVADNLNKWELTESETLLFGRNFGVGTDVQTGPNGNLFVVSLDQGAVYEIFRARTPDDDDEDDDEDDDD